MEAPRARAPNQQTIDTATPLLQQISEIRASVYDKQAYWGGQEQKLLMLAKYIVQADTSGYKLNSVHKLALALFVDGENWRGHSDAMFRYRTTGAWKQAEGLSVDSWKLFTALEGLFINLAEKEKDNNDLEWSWGVVSSKIIKIVQDVIV